MKKFELGKDYLLLAILTLLTVLSWTALAVYQSASKTVIPRVTQEQISPLDPKIKLEILEGLQSKLSFK